jgi:hypothetical protein
VKILSDDGRIIDFNEQRNKVKDKDIDKFEEYIYSLYYDVMNGKISMSKFSLKILDYMKENNISEQKFIEIQKKFMERYGMNVNDVEKDLEQLGINLEDYNKVVKEEIYDKDVKEEIYDELKEIDNIDNIDNIYSIDDIDKKRELDLLLFGSAEQELSMGTSLTFRFITEFNDVEVIFLEDRAYLNSKKDIVLGDPELNRILVLYKESCDYKKIKVVICENVKDYEY